MKFLALPLLLLTANTALALDAACEPFIAAAEKAAQQPARHSVMELAGGMRMEAIVVGGVGYSLSGGKWQKLPIDLMAAERELNADIRSGKIGLSGCSSGAAEPVEGISTTALTYTMTMPGAAPVTATVQIGEDGLIHAQSSADVKIRYRYTGVTAPQL